MDETKTVMIAGAEALIHGNPDDFYFAHAQAHADGLSPLGDQARTVPPTGLSIDAGCNIGLSTILLARCRPEATVIAIDPSPVNIAFLRKNLAANAITNVEVVEAALSDRPGTLNLHVSGAWSHIVGAAHLTPGLASVAVPVRTLDQLVAGRGPVSFVKIDTEGHEPHVLVGGRAMIERDRPLMLMEFNTWCLTGVSGGSPAAFARALWAAFEVQRIRVDGQVEDSGETAHDFLHGNMTQRGLVDDLLMRLREGVTVPTLAELTLPVADADELLRLRAENQALRASTSWRLTEPLRRVAGMMKR